MYQEKLISFTITIIVFNLHAEKNEWLQSKTDMSSISQSILMALTVTVNKYASSNVQAVHRKRKSPTTTSSDIGRRGLFLSTVVAALQVSDSRTELLNSKYVPY